MNITYHTAILLVINNFRGLQQNFSAYDVTRELRRRLNDREMSLSDYSATVSIGGNGQTVVDINHENVKTYVNELYTCGLIHDYTRNYNQGGYNLYTYVGSVTTSTATGSPITTTIFPSTSTISGGSVTSGPNTLEFKIRTYVNNKHTQGETPTLKAIQSRLKTRNVYIGQIAQICRSLGFTIANNANAPYKSVVA